jgi:crossover junction endodeoxyribonuclease RusA
VPLHPERLRAPASAAVRHAAVPAGAWELMRLTVIGMPATQGSKRGFPVRRKNGTIGVALVESGGEHHRSWREAVAAEARRVADGAPLDEPVVATFTFYLPRPKSAKKSVLFPDKKPDSLKLARAVEDALTKILYSDDSRIVTHTIRKRFAVDRPPGVEISIRKATAADL